MSLTIKQAFEALSDACANGMKNPFFVMRRLKESFADVASKVVDASGDKVIVTPITDSGTKIATIKVNNSTSELYAPDASETYVEVETKIGSYLGAELYRRVIALTSVTLSGTNDVIIDTIDTGLNIVNIKSCIYENGIWVAWPETNIRLTYTAADGNIKMKGLSTSVNWVITNGNVILEYTKPST